MDVFKLQNNGIRSWNCILGNDGFIANDYDPGRFNKSKNGKQITIWLHGDDCICTWTNKLSLEDLSAKLSNEYRDLTSHWSTEHS